MADDADAAERAAKAARAKERVSELLHGLDATSWRIEEQYG